MRDTVWILADFLADNLTVCRHNCAVFFFFLSFFLFFPSFYAKISAVPPDNYDLYRRVRLITLALNSRNF